MKPVRLGGNFVDNLNQVFAETSKLLGFPLSTYGRSAPFRYFKQGSTAFCWNTRPLTATAETKYREWAAWKYRVNRQKGSWRLTGKAIYFARRKSAKAKALQWYRKAREKKRTTSPTPLSTAAATTPNTLPPTNT